MANKWTTRNIPTRMIAELEEIGLETVGGKTAVKPDAIQVIQMLIDEYNENQGRKS